MPAPYDITIYIDRTVRNPTARWRWCLRKAGVIIDTSDCHYATRDAAERNYEAIRRAWSEMLRDMVEVL